MEYGLIVTSEQIQKLNNSDIEFTFWDEEQINFETEKERQRAIDFLKEV